MYLCQVVTKNVCFLSINQVTALHDKPKTTTNNNNNNNNKEGNPLKT